MLRYSLWLQASSVAGLGNAQLVFALAAVRPEKLNFILKDLKGALAELFNRL